MIWVHVYSNSTARAFGRHYSSKILDQPNTTTSLALSDDLFLSPVFSLPAHSFVFDIEAGFFLNFKSPEQPTNENDDIEERLNKRSVWID
jgi:hypothetical protein